MAFKITKPSTWFKRPSPKAGDSSSIYQGSQPAPNIPAPSGKPPEVGTFVPSPKPSGGGGGGGGSSVRDMVGTVSTSQQTIQQQQGTVSSALPQSTASQSQLQQQALKLQQNQAEQARLQAQATAYTNQANVYYSSNQNWKPNDPNAVVVYIDRTGRTTGKTSVGDIQAGVSVRNKNKDVITKAVKGAYGEREAYNQGGEKVIYSESGKPVFVESEYFGQTVKYEDYLKRLEKIDKEMPVVKYSTSKGEIKDTAPIPIKLGNFQLKPEGFNIYIDPNTGKPIENIRQYLQEKNIPISNKPREPPKDIKDFMSVLNEIPTYDVQGLRGSGNIAVVGDTMYGAEGGKYSGSASQVTALDIGTLALLPTKGVTIAKLIYGSAKASIPLIGYKAVELLSNPVAQQVIATNVIASKEIVGMEENLIAKYAGSSSVKDQSIRAIINIVDEPFTGVAYKTELAKSLFTSPTETLSGLTSYAKENPIEVGGTILLGGVLGTVAYNYRGMKNYLMKDTPLSRLTKTPETSAILKDIVYVDKLEYGASQYFKDLVSTPKGMDFYDYTLRERIRLSPEQTIQLKNLIQAELDLKDIYKETGAKPSYSLTKDLFSDDLKALQENLLTDLSTKNIVVAGSTAKLAELQTQAGIKSLGERGLLSPEQVVTYSKAGDIDVAVYSNVALGTQKFEEGLLPAQYRAKAELSQTELGKVINVDKIKEVESFILKNELNKGIELDMFGGLSDYQRLRLENAPAFTKVKGSVLRKTYDLALSEKTDFILEQVGDNAFVSKKRTKGYYSPEETIAVKERLDLTGKDIDREVGNILGYKVATSQTKKTITEKFPELEQKEMKFTTIEKGLPQVDEPMLGGFIIRQEGKDLFVGEGRATQITTNVKSVEYVKEVVKKRLQSEEYLNRLLREERLKYLEPTTYAMLEEWGFIKDNKNTGVLGLQTITKSKGGVGIKTIVIPKELKFQDPTEYMRTLTHELIHTKQSDIFKSLSRLLPYSLRPSELLAEGLSDYYMKKGFSVTDKIINTIEVNKKLTSQKSPKKAGDFELDLYRVLDKSGEAMEDIGLGGIAERQRYKKLAGKEITFYSSSGDKLFTGKKLSSYFDDLLDRLVRTEEVADVYKVGQKVAGEIDTSKVKTQFINPNVELKLTGTGAKSLSAQQVLRLIELDKEVVGVTSDTARRSVVYKQPEPTKLADGELSYPEPSKLAEFYSKADYPDLFYDKPTIVDFEGKQVKIQSRTASGISNALAYISREVFPEMGTAGKDIIRRASSFEGQTKFLKEEISKVKDVAKRERLTAKLNEAIRREMAGEGVTEAGDISFRKEYVKSLVSRRRESAFIDYNPRNLLTDADNLGEIKLTQDKLSLPEARKKLKEFIEYKTPAYKSQSAYSKAVSELDKQFGGESFLSNQKASQALNIALKTAEPDILGARKASAQALKSYLNKPYQPTFYDELSGDLKDLYSNKLYATPYDNYGYKKSSYSPYYPNIKYSAYSPYTPYKATYSAYDTKSYKPKSYAPSAYTSYDITEPYIKKPYSPYKPYKARTPYKPYKPYTPYLPPITPRPPTIKFKYNKEPKEKVKKMETYSLFVRRRGKFKAIGSDLTLGEAKKLGADISLSSLARTFRLSKTGRTKDVFSIDQSYEPDLQVFRQYKVRGGRRIDTPEQFIQRQRFSLSSVGEQREIQQAKRRRQELNQLMSM